MRVSLQIFQTIFVILL